jgi:hypothetical protein
MSKTKKSIIAFNYGEFAAIKSFKPIEFEGFKNRLDSIATSLPQSNGSKKTGGIGLVSKPGRYGQYDRQ